jgi:hypothetical protein
MNVLVRLYEMKNGIFVLFFLFTTLVSTAQQEDLLVVYFKFNEHALDEDSKNKIDKYIEDLNGLGVSIYAHCDSVGSNEYNDALSLKRAEAVKQYLVSKNLNADFIKIKASGKRKPINKNETEQERAMNRRAEIYFRRIHFTPPDVSADTVVKVDTAVSIEKSVPAKDTIAEVAGKLYQSHDTISAPRLLKGRERSLRLARVSTAD